MPLTGDAVALAVISEAEACGFVREPSFGPAVYWEYRHEDAAEAASYLLNGGFTMPDNEAPDKTLQVDAETYTLTPPQWGKLLFLGRAVPDQATDSIRLANGFTADDDIVRGVLNAAQRS